MYAAVFNIRNMWTNFSTISFLLTYCKFSSRLYQKIKNVIYLQDSNARGRIRFKLEILQELETQTN